MRTLLIDTGVLAAIIGVIVIQCTLRSMAKQTGRTWFIGWRITDGVGLSQDIMKGYSKRFPAGSLKGFAVTGRWLCYAGLSACLVGTFLN